MQIYVILTFYLVNVIDITILGKNFTVAIISYPTQFSVRNMHFYCAHLFKFDSGITHYDLHTYYHIYSYTFCANM